MAYEDPVVFVLILFVVAVVILVYVLAKFLAKANRFLDEQERKQKDQQSPKTQP